jgi:transmembrane sensor
MLEDHKPMSESFSDRDGEALTWLVMTNDPEFDRWDEFTRWLEQDPGNAESYHRLVDAERRVLPLVEQLSRTALPRSVVPQRRRATDQMSPRRWALALSGAGALAVSGLLIQRAAPIAYETGAGERRTVALGGEDRIIMNGQTRVAVAGLDRRSISLEGGEVLLLLRDSGAAPVRVHAGDLELVDVGTVFSVARSARSTRVVVAEGEVVADPAGAKLRLPAGMRLDAQDGQTVLRAERADPDSVGAWRFGQLVYTGEALANVVGDLSRSTGIEFRADRSITAQTFTGTLSLDAVKRDPRSLEPLLGVSMNRSGSGWIVGGARS